MAHGRIPIIPSSQNPPIVRDTYYPQGQGDRADPIASGTIVGAFPLTVRRTFVVSKPTILVLHGGITNPPNGRLRAQFAPEPYSQQPGLLGAPSMFPCYGGRAAYFWAPGTWYLDVQVTSTIDFDMFSCEDRDVATAWLAQFDGDLNSQTAIVIPDQILAGADTQVVRFDTMLASRAVLLQNTGAAGDIRITFAQAAAANTGYLLSTPFAGTGISTLLLIGAKMNYSEIRAFGPAGATLGVTQFLFGWTHL